MIKKLFITYTIILAFLAIACSTIQIGPRKKVYEMIIKPYVEEFSYKSGISMESLEKIEYYIYLSLPGNAAGVCTIPKEPFLPRQISLRLDYLVFGSELQKKSIIFHEILHCYCGRQHIRLHGSYWKMFGWNKISNNDGTCPMSIMYPTTISSDCLEQNWEEYMEEAFSTCPRDMSTFLRYHQR